MKLFFSETGSNDTNILDTNENSQFDTTAKTTSLTCMNLKHY